MTGKQQLSKQDKKYVFITTVFGTVFFFMMGSVKFIQFGEFPFCFLNIALPSN